MRITDRLLLTLALLPFTDLVTAAGLPSRDGSALWLPANQKSANLQQTLESGLRARRPEEFAFIKRVVLTRSNRRPCRKHWCAARLTGPETNDRIRYPYL